MAFLEKIKLAFYNLTHRKKTTAQCVLMMSFIMVLVFISSFFIATLTIQLSDGLNNYAHDNFITILYNRMPLNEDYQPDNTLLGQKEQEEFKAKFNSVGDINYYYTPYLFSPISMAYCNLILDEEIYKTSLVNGDEITIINDESVLASSVLCKAVNTPTFSQNLQDKFYKEFPDEKIITYGRDILHENEILLPEGYLNFFDVSWEELLTAESVTLELPSGIAEGWEGTFSNAKVAGLINEKLFTLEYKTIYSGLGVLFNNELIYLASINDIPTDDMEPFVYPQYTIQRIELENSTEVEDVLDYLYEKFSYEEIEWYENYSINYANQSKFNEIDTINKILTFVWNIIIILFFVLGVGLIVFLYSVMEHSAKQKGSYFGMIRAMGERSTLSVIIIETVIMTFFAAVISLLISAILAYTLSGTIINISWGTSYEFIVSTDLFVLVFMITLLVVAALNIFVAFLSSRRYNKKSITAALRN